MTQQLFDSTSGIGVVVRAPWLTIIGSSLEQRRLYAFDYLPPWAPEFQHEPIRARVAGDKTESTDDDEIWSWATEAVPFILTAAILLESEGSPLRGERLPQTRFDVSTVDETSVRH